MEAPKLLFFTLEFPPQIGGIAAYLAGLIQQYPANKISILVNKGEMENIASRHFSFSIYQRKLLMTIPFWPRWLPALWHLVRTIRQEKSSFVVVPQLLPLGFVVYLASLVVGIKYIISLHGFDIHLVQQHWRKRIISKIILRQASGIMSNSQFTEQALLQLIGSLSSVPHIIIYPCPSVTRSEVTKDHLQLPTQGKVSERPMVLLSVARLVYRKGIDRVIKLLPKLVNRYPSLVYVIVGSGPEREFLQNLATSCGVLKKVYFVGSKRGQDLANYYAAADIFVLPVRSEPPDVEGFGMVFLEAQLFGLPIVATKSGGIPEAVEDGVSGILLSSESEQELLQAMLVFIEQPKVRAQMGQKGMLRVQNSFTWPRQGKRFREWVATL